jgi:hypothetical protein
MFNGFRFMGFNATFTNISDISWRPVFLVEGTGKSGAKTPKMPPENKELLHIMLYYSP